MFPLPTSEWMDKDVIELYENKSRITKRLFTHGARQGRKMIPKDLVLEYKTFDTKHYATS